MRILLWAGLFFIALAVCSLSGCSSGDAVVLEVGQGKVTLGEYERFFVRNSSGWEAGKKSTQEEREHFLDLLSNYKVKLMDAYGRNLQNDSEIIQELKDYRSSLAATFLIDRDVNEPGIRRLHDRRKEEIRAQHVLFTMKAGASPEETLAVWKKAMDVVRRAKAGENFDSLAVRYSTDPSAKSNHGDIYYFTSGQMMEAFENAAYTMKKGEVSPAPVRTQLGYHVIKVIDRSQSRGSYKVRHVMARFKVSEADSADTIAALKRINAMQDSLKKGWDFSLLAIKFSEDGGSAQQGGELGWFERRRWVQPFDEACFKLTAGQTSGIVKSPFGYHIIRCDSVKPVASLAEMHEELKQQYQRFRYADDYAVYIQHLKQQYHYSLNEPTVNAFFSHLDSMKTVGDSAWDGGINQETRRLPMMSVNNKPVALDVILGTLDKKPEFRNTPLRRSDLTARLDHIAETLLLDEESAGLEQKSPEFASLMNEYEQGVVLFKAEQSEVWNNVAVTDSALRNYFKENPGKFMFGERVAYSEIRVSSDTLAYIIYDSLTHGGDFNTLAARYNDDPESKAKRGDRGLKPVNSDELTTLATKMHVGEISEPQELESNYSIIKVTRREQPREKTYEEAGAEVSNAYQEFLSKQIEQNWVDRIRQKYLIKEYKERLKDAFKSSPPAQ